ncbi:hypothetical protein M9Y10_026406 [Tritrichomonas musculus]|uniref:DUF3447 domain-containing protein n=1 Tax=Tritrichomonas musculus TaxID=1915356 RepID=A0ABR2H8B7_9EUKA
MNHCDYKQLLEDYFRKLGNIEENLIMFLDNQEENTNLFIQYLNKQKISESKYELRSFFYLIVSTSNYYHRSADFFNKIELIITIFQEQIQNYFTSLEIFDIFQSSKRLLLFLFKSGILTPTEQIYKRIINHTKYLEKKYLEYFYPEFEAYFDANIRKVVKEIRESNNDEFKQKRENGENDNYLFKLIRNDQIVDFVRYLEQTNISPSSIIQSSIYETNLLIINKYLSLIEYSAFCGSIQIFKYLYYRKAELTTSIWPYAIHGKNAEIIHFLEEKKIETLCNSYQYLIIESIKCHNNEIIYYFLNNFCENERIYNDYLYIKSCKYYNFGFLKDGIINLLNKSNIPYYLCKYDYNLVIELLCNANNFDINREYTIFKPFHNQSKDIVSYIALKNGDLSHLFSEKEKEIERQFPIHFQSIQERKKFTQYEYDVETSTILHIAIRRGNIGIIQFLLSMKSIELNKKSTKVYKKLNEMIRSSNHYFIITTKKSILHESIENGNEEVVQSLLNNKNIDINEPVLKEKVCDDTVFYYEKKNSNSIIASCHKKQEHEYY